MTVDDLLSILHGFSPSATVRFSVADDSSEDPGERWFCEDGIEDCFADSDDHDEASEVTICLVGKSNFE